MSSFERSVVQRKHIQYRRNAAVTVKARSHRSLQLKNRQFFKKRQINLLPTFRVANKILELQTELRVSTQTRAQRLHWSLVASVSEPNLFVRSIRCSPICAFVVVLWFIVLMMEDAAEGTFDELENGGIKPGLCGITLGVRKNPKDFCFLAWNWPLIRKCCFWGMMSLTVACVCVIIGYITTLPTRCDPPRSWYQGSLIYEIFPASFHDTDDDGQGDLRGISAKVHYLESMGVRGVRLNSIFPSENYPEHYYNVENLTQIEPVLGSFADFRFLVNTLHELNISLILDLPLGSFFKHQEENAKQTNSVGHAHHVIINNHILNSNVNKTVYLTPDLHGAISEVLDFWLSHGVDGFYLKDLENLVGDEKFQQHIRQWKGVLKRHKQGFDKILICSEKVIKILENDQILSTKLATVLTHFDLVDTHIEMSRDVKSQIDAVQGGVMFSRPGYPWPLWTLGSMDTTRLASRLPSANASLAAILVGMMLPGTPSVFYGDEIGLDNLHDTDKQDD
ncbi:hypothetical protein J6590_021528 [Homalodisca vitripennis]|nr:hypothetical protein J6590_021528 [Homalodisca vitripennis]